MKNISNHPLNSTVQVANFDRSKLKSKIVHLGFGAFHRAHQGLYTSELAQQSDSDWGICEVNLFGGETLIKALREQDHLYTVLEKGADGFQAKLSGSITESLHSGLDGIEAILAKMSEPQIAIVSLTVTEKGYCTDAASGKLDRSNSLIRADLDNPTAPTSAVGLIVEALRLRKEAGIAPFTVMSCDNIQENGHVAKSAILEYAHLTDESLSQWIGDNVTFPCTMVDRIVPAATQETLDEIANNIGVYDPCGIACEPFRQWVIEDNFVAGRPKWDQIGAQFVSDVVPYEEMKLRMLNGTHSFLAYLGYLAGYQHISDTMADPHFKAVALKVMMQAQAPTLTMPAGTDLQGYADSLIARFTNPSLKHRTWQIAMDGSQKIPQRFGGSLRYNLAHNRSLDLIATAIAGWIRYATAVDENGQTIDVQDPMASQLAALFTTHGTQPNVVKIILSLESIFPADIGQNAQVIEQVTQAYTSLLNIGARRTVAALATL
jgi:fructuronate reductase